MHKVCLKADYWDGYLARRNGEFWGNEYGHLFSHEVLKRDFNDLRMSSEYRQIADFLGCDDSHYKLGLMPSHNDRILARELISDRDFDSSKPIVAVAPFTTDSKALARALLARAHKALC